MQLEIAGQTVTIPEPPVALRPMPLFLISGVVKGEIVLTEIIMAATAEQAIGWAMQNFGVEFAFATPYDRKLN